MAYLGKSPSQGVRNRYYFTASGGETSISGALTGGTLTFTDGNYVDVNLNGVTLVAGTDYNTSTANTIAGLSALTASDVVEIVVYDVFSVFSGNVNSDFSVGGNLSVTGTTAFTGATTITGLTTTGDINFGDNDKAVFGAGSDLQIYHDGSNSYIIDNGTGDLVINTNGNAISLNPNGGGEYGLRVINNGAVNLYYDNALKLATTATGVAVTGNATFADNGKAIFGAGSDLEIYHDGSNSFIVDNGTGGLQLRGSTFVALQGTNGENGVLVTENGSAQLRFNNSPTLETTATGVDVTGNANFADNGKAIFGAGSDLQIYHNGSHSYIDDTGTGNLYIRGDNINFRRYTGDDFAKFISDGAVELYYDNVKKLETTATGADITGVLTADGVTVTGTNANLVLGTTGSNVTFNRNGDNYISASGGTSSNIILDPQNRLAINTGGSERMRILSDGRVTIGHSAAINISILGISNRNATSDRMFAIHNASGTNGFFNQIAFRNNADSANIGEIVRVNDASVSYNTTSDYRLKENVTDITGATERLKQLNPVRFNFIADPDRTVDGFLAHEVQDVVPEAITGTKDEIDADGNPVMQGIDQSKIVPLLVKTIQELEARIAALEA